MLIFEIETLWKYVFYKIKHETEHLNIFFVFD